MLTQLVFLFKLCVDVLSVLDIFKTSAAVKAFQSLIQIEK